MQRRSIGAELVQGALGAAIIVALAMAFVAFQPPPAVGAPSDTCDTAAFNVEDFAKNFPGSRSRAFERGEAVVFMVAMVEMFGPPPGQASPIAGVSVHVVPQTPPDQRGGVELRMYGEDGCALNFGARISKRELRAILDQTGLVWPDADVFEIPA